VTYYIGLGFIITGAFLAARSVVGLRSHVIDESSDLAGLYIVQAVFGLSMSLFGFFLRHSDFFESADDDEEEVTPAPTPASAEVPPRKKRPARNPNRG